MRALSEWSKFVLMAATGAATLLVGASSGAHATKTGDAAKVTVIELFTSQGCSSCPTADALLKSYTERENVVALTLPVDYWDYLGWKDTLASPKFSSRQRAYSKARGDGRVYTPQVVVNGLKHVLGSSEPDIDKAIAVTTALIDRSRVGVRVRIVNEHIVIDLDAAREGTAVSEATIWLALIRSKIEVKIKRGENQGKMAAYYNVVREWNPVGMWNGKAATITLAHHAVKQSGADGCAIIVQNGDAGPIIGAALLPTW